MFIFKQEIETGFGVAVILIAAIFAGVIIYKSSQVEVGDWAVTRAKCLEDIDCPKSKCLGLRTVCRMGRCQEVDKQGKKVKCKEGEITNKKFKDLN